MGRRRSPPCCGQLSARGAGGPALTGRLATMMAANMMTQPMVSRMDIISPKRAIPASNAKTDSRQRIMEAMVGSVSFWPRIWQV